MIRTLQSSAEWGQSLVEFALLAPFVLFFLLALVDFGIAIDRRIILDHAVREGARYASVGGQALTTGTTATEQQVRSYTSAQAQGIVPATDITVQNENCNPNGDLGDNVKVTANYTYNFVTGFNFIVPGLDPSIDMTASATARVEHGLAGAISNVACP
jgi:Flp pilus assembly protein TadG